MLALAEAEPGLYDLRVVEDHQCAFGQEFGQVTEMAFRHLPPLIDKQLAAVAFLQRKLGNAFVGQGIVIVLYPYMPWVNVSWVSL